MELPGGGGAVELPGGGEIVLLPGGGGVVVLPGGGGVVVLPDGGGGVVLPVGEAAGEGDELAGGEGGSACKRVLDWVGKTALDIPRAQLPGAVLTSSSRKAARGSSPSILLGILAQI